MKLVRSLWPAISSTVSQKRYLMDNEIIVDIYLMWVHVLVMLLELGRSWRALRCKRRACTKMWQIHAAKQSLKSSIKNILFHGSCKPLQFYWKLVTCCLLPHLPQSPCESKNPNLFCKTVSCILLQINLQAFSEGKEELPGSSEISLSLIVDSETWKGGIVKIVTSACLQI